MCIVSYVVSLGWVVIVVVQFCALLAEATLSAWRFFSPVTSPSRASTRRLVLLIDSSREATFLAASVDESLSSATLASRLPNSEMTNVSLKN